MFNFMKRKDKTTTTQQGDEVWGMPPRNRKMSKDEAARDAAQQKLIEEKNQERRAVYRPAGRERIFEDTDGRRLALRTEENFGPEASPHRPPLQIVAFWGVREIGYVRAEIEPQGRVRQLVAHIETGYEQRGIASEILQELETVARSKEAKEICCTGLAGNEWSNEFLTQAGYTSRGAELVKTLG